MMQCQMQDMQNFEEFRHYNKKPDGSDYTYQEYLVMQGQAISNLKAEGYDIIAEQNKIIRENREFEEELNEKYNPLRARQHKPDGYTESSTATASSSTSSSSSSSSTSAGMSQYQPDEKEYDARQQFRREMVASEDYHLEGKITLFRRDGSKAIKDRDAELYKKGAYYYVKIDDTFYPRMSSNWLLFKNQIHYKGALYW